MANRYIYHGGSNTSPYDTWAKAATTITTGLTGGASTDSYYLASDHAESTAAGVTPVFPNSGVNLPSVLSVNRAGSVPPVAADITAGAVITTTGASAITLAGRSYVYGGTFNCGTGASAANMVLANGGKMLYENCAFNLVNTSASSLIIVGTSGAALRSNNCTISFGATGQSLSIAGDGVWNNKPGSTAITGATLPTTLITAGTTETTFEMRGLDLSALGSGKTIVGSAVICKVLLINCKLDSAVTVAVNPVNRGALGTWLYGCHSAGNVRRDEIYTIGGTLTTETTIVRTGGASDGTTAFSWKIVPTANNRLADAFETFEGGIWNEEIGAAMTLTAHTVTDNVTLIDAEIWLEVEYLGSAGAPVSFLVSDGPATVLTAGTNQPASGEAWTTTGLTTPVKQKLEVTFTPEIVGLIRWKVKYAKTSTTVYVCPKAELS